MNKSFGVTYDQPRTYNNIIHTCPKQARKEKTKAANVNSGTGNLLLFEVAEPEREQYEPIRDC
jgi:hypothetical protein